MDNQNDGSKELAIEGEVVEAGLPTELQDQEWFTSLLDDCKAIVVEHEFTSRWALIEGYHALGQRILEENDNLNRVAIYGKKIQQAIAESTGKSERSINYAVAFVRKYPNLDELPEGKNVSWFKITQKYLPKLEKEETPKKTPPEKVEVAETIDTPETAPRPNINIQWNKENELWEVIIAPDSFVFLDVTGLKRQIDDYLESLKA